MPGPATRPLERALRAAGFKADTGQVWRWVSGSPGPAVVKFELLADLEDVPAEVVHRLR